MSSITYSDFAAGLDVRKGASVSDANRLRALTNAYVTTGKTIKKRPGLSFFASIENGTVGLRAANGKLNTFYGVGSISHADTRFLANKVAHPTVSQAVTRIHFADMFNGFLYVSAEYVDGSIKHHYLDGASPTHIADANCPNTAAVAKKASKLFAVKNDVVRFCSTNNARDWTTAANAGFLPTGVQQSGATNATALGEYSNQLVVFFRDSAQVWNVDPDPAKMSYAQGVAIGCPYPYGAANMAGDVFFVSPNGVRSITVTAVTGNLIDIDVGSPVDSLIKPTLGVSSYPRAFYYRGGGQFWVVIDQNAWVYSFSRTAKVSAWSKYSFPFQIDDVTELDGVLYIRHENNVYRLNEGEGTDSGAVFDVEIEFPYLDMQAPGVLKQITGVDAVMTGSADISFRWDARHPDLETQQVELFGDSRPGQITPVEVCSVHVAPRIVNSSTESFELNAIQFYFQSLGFYL